MPFRRIVILAIVVLVTAGCSVVEMMSGRPPRPAAVGPRRSFAAYEILDPYAVPGFWAKAQLHVHTDKSIDGKWPISQALEVYAGLGYDFVAITDHDAVHVAAAVPRGLTVVTGEEHTLSHPLYPLGQHAVFLFTERRASGTSIEGKFRDVVSQGGLAVVAHPSWNGYGGYGEWHLWQLAAAPSFHMMEVFNPYSDPDIDTALWHEVLWRRGPYDPVWAIAVDDAHDATGVNRGWTMVKVEGRDPEHLRSALLRGSHYATTGIIADFGVDENGAIWATSSEPAEIVFINALRDPVLRLDNALKGRYQPVGTEGFIRIEIRGRTSGRRAWSQPFWLVESPWATSSE